MSELVAAIPESGGAYAYARKVLSVRAAFAVGWVLWFAYIVASALYALGFGAFAVAAVREVWTGSGRAWPAWAGAHGAGVALGVVAAAAFSVRLALRGGGGTAWINVVKVALFALLIAGGLWRLLAQAAGGGAGPAATPWWPHGAGGVLAAMGVAFIAVQGFEAIATVSGDVRAPEKTVPRAMFLSLGVALAIYLPLLWVVGAAGPAAGRSAIWLARAHPETMVAVAAGRFLGAAGWWVVSVAAILATLSALEACLLSASRLALAMARDRALPRALGRVDAVRGTPGMAVGATAVACASVLFMVPDLAAAGAASGLIFMVSFAMVHGIAVLARRRAAAPPPWRTPAWPFVPVAGGLACAALALYQAVAVPAAGAITAVWLALGVLLYFALFAARAEVVDAMAEARDPEMARLRGKNPLVLVPVANPASAPGLVAVANAIAPPDVGRVLLLSVVTRAGEAERPAPGAVPRELGAATDVLREAVAASLSAGLSPEGLVTVAPVAWSEIARVARAHACESLLVGLSRLDDGGAERRLEELLGDVECDVAVLRAPAGWRLEEVRTVLVPIGGRGGHDELRARVLGSLARTGERRVVFLRLLARGASADEERAARAEAAALAEDEAPGRGVAEVARADDVAAAIASHSAGAHLVVLGVQRLGRRRKAFGALALQVARDNPGATLMLSRRG